MSPEHRETNAARVGAALPVCSPRFDDAGRWRETALGRFLPPRRKPETWPRTPSNTERAGFDILGLFAFLEITELRGFQVLSAYRSFADDPATLAVIDSVLADEHFHVAYSHLQLERWVKKGLATEVAAARREARRIDRRALRQQVASFVSSPLRRANEALFRRPRNTAGLGPHPFA